MKPTDSAPGDPDRRTFLAGVLAAAGLAATSGSFTLLTSACSDPVSPRLGSGAGSLSDVESNMSSGNASQPKPTIVLVHGAWADGSSWNGVVSRLQHDGFTVDVPPNPLRSLAGDTAYLRAFLATITGPIVLVGHSYGGAVITNAATGNPNVEALVYVDAYVPDENQTLLEMTAAKPGSVFAVADPSTVFNFVPYPGGPPGDVDLYVKPGLFARALTGNLPAMDAAVLAASQRPLTFSALGERSGVPAWKTIPAWAVIGTEDQAIPRAEQLALAENAHAHIVEVRAPHLSVVTDPEVVTKVILEAASVVPVHA
jgi:pimeloyl-ACP methyl ester carboxylesterase